MSGGVLLSHRVAPAVPSALRVLASGFGMCPGVSLALWPPKLWYQHPATRGVGWGVVVSVTPLHGPVGTSGWGVSVLSLCVLSLCVLGFRLLGTTEWTRAILGHARQPYNSVCVVIVKLSAY